jgi:hypothetical protein
MAKEGNRVRILGAWIGNGGDELQPWNTIKTKIINRLGNWGKSNPGTEGRRHIIQMTVQGMTQYLTAAQGMPEKIEEDLAKLSSNFLWKDTKARINLNSMADNHYLQTNQHAGLKLRKRFSSDTAHQTNASTPNPE